MRFVPKGLINNIPAMLQIMAWRRRGDKPLSEPMMVRLPTHIYASLGLKDLINIMGIFFSYACCFVWSLSYLHIYTYTYFKTLN